MTSVGYGDLGPQNVLERVSSSSASESRVRVEVFTRLCGFARLRVCGPVESNSESREFSFCLVLSGALGGSVFVFVLGTTIQEQLFPSACFALRHRLYHHCAGGRCGHVPKHMLYLFLKPTRNSALRRPPWQALSVRSSPDPGKVFVGLKYWAKCAPSPRT